MNFAAYVIIGGYDDARDALSLDPSLANRRDCNGFLPIALAVYAKRELIVSLLAKYGADLNLPAHSEYQEPFFYEVFMEAATFRRFDSLKLLSSHFDLDRFADDAGATLLMKSCLHNVELVELLVEGGMSASTNDRRGNTALHYLAHTDTVAMSTSTDARRSFELLLQAGAQIGHRNASGKTAEMIVQEQTVTTEFSGELLRQLRARPRMLANAVSTISRPPGPKP